MNTSYTAENIRILSPEEIRKSFAWAESAALAEQYRKPEKWIARGLRACEKAGVSHTYFVSRYLENLPTPRHEGVEEAMLELLKKNRPGPAQTN